MTARAVVRERPILFSGPMVRAILDGSKTQTRRVVKPQPCAEVSDVVRVGQEFVAAYPNRSAIRPSVYATPPRYGRPGDRLWVREAHAVLDMRSDVTDFASAREPRGEWPASVTYLADDATVRFPNVDARDWRAGFDNDHVIRRPSIHMPRWACRIVLELSEVRVERVQAITEAEAIAEGVTCPQDSTRCGIAKVHFADLWEHLNAKRGFGWDVNPWVWVLSFRRVEP